MWRTVSGVSVVIVGLLFSVVSALADPAVAGYPNAMAATGDSITAAFVADGTPTVQAQYSWATGAAATVNSHLLRIQTANAIATGSNDAVGGARMADLAAQMQTVNGQGVTYVTVLMGGNDVCAGSEATMTSVVDFAAQFQSAMNTLTAGSPTARVFVASIPDVYQLWSILHDNATADYIWSTYGVCQAMLANPTSLDQVDVDRRARVRQRVIDYNTQLQTICAQYLRCRFDGNAVFSYTFTTSDVSTYDYFHPSVQGQMHLAAATWPATFDFTDGTPPASTATTTPDATGFTVALSATDNAGVAGIETSLDGGAWRRYSAPVSAGFGHTLTYRAVDINANGEATHTFAPVVQPATLTSAQTLGAGGVSLAWTASPTASTHTVSYTVLRRPTGGAFAAVASLGGTSYTDLPATDGSYEYAVQAWVGTAFSLGSNVLGALSDRTGPTAGVLSAATGATSGTVSASWTAATDSGVGVGDYTLRWVQANVCPAPSTSAYPSSLDAGLSTSVVVSGLQSHKAYCFYVTSTDAVGNVGAPTNTAGAKAN